MGSLQGRRPVAKSPPSHEWRDIAMTKRNWKKHLTDNERKELFQLEKKLDALAIKTLILRNLRTKIQNRASARAGKA